MESHSESLQNHNHRRLLSQNSRDFCWRQLFCRSVVLILAFVITFDSALADKATDDFNLGMGFYRGKRWEQAEETLGQFLKDFPEHSRTNIARLYHARSLNMLEKYDVARLEFAEFINAEPNGKDAPDARYRLGECSYFLKDYPATITQLLEYTTKHSDHTHVVWANLLLGDSYVAVKEYQKAIEILVPLSKAQSNKSILTDARFSLGKALEGLKKTQEAVEQYKAVVTEKSSAVAPRALNRIGSIQYASSQYSEAAASFEQLISVYSTSTLVPSATLGAGMSWYRAGEYDKALEWLRRVPRESPSAAQAVMMTAMSLKELGRIEESRQVFADALQVAGNTPLAADILFQQAQMERVSGTKELATQLFEDISDRWPQSNRTAECLFNASELRLELNQPEQAEKLWNRLKTDYPEIAARPREQILLGRLFLDRGDIDKSIEILQQACGVSKAQQDRVTAVGRYYLVRALHKARRHDKVIEQTSMMSELFRIEAFSEVRGALALAAISSLELKDYDGVLKFADEFLPIAKDETQKSDVMAAQAVAFSHLKQFSDANRVLRNLTATHPDAAPTWSAVLQAAEAALEQNSPDDAAAFFNLAASYDKDSAVKEAGVTGMAWSHFKAAKFVEAEKSFTRVIDDYPSSEDAAQSLFMRARCVEEQGNTELTAAAYADVFAKLTKDQPPASAGSESAPPMQFAFDAGRQAARALDKLKRSEEADKAWEALVRQFPDAKDLDRILDEWAWMNVTAERFEKSDAVHRQLLDRFPASPYAGQARLSLAESLLEAGKLDESLKEMEAIIADDRYGAAEKERSLFHVIEIQAATRKWQPLITAAEGFLDSYSMSPLAPQVRLFVGNALLELQKPKQAAETLTALRDEIVAQKVPEQDWTDRVWIVLAEAALALKNYDQIDVLETELKQRSEKSLFAFQMMDVQGRRWKQQAPPDFEKARVYLRAVTSDVQGEGTETAARCQFLVAETLVLEMKLEEAVKEYFKVYLSYSYDELRAQALFQAATCQVRLQKNDAALRDYKELIAMFPTSNLVEKASAEIKKLEVTSQ